MWCIKGRRKDYSRHDCRCCYHNSINDEEIIATFDTQDQAKEYLKEATLKAMTYTDKFKVKSLLCGCSDAWVEEVEEESPPPHNPEFGK